jgi:hypothetical protein
MLIFGMAALLIINAWLGAVVLGSSLVMMITYVWSCREPMAVVSMFGFKLQVRPPHLEGTTPARPGLTV